MAKKSPGSGKNKSNLKATVIVILIATVVGGIFLFFNKDHQLKKDHYLIPTPNEIESPVARKHSKKSAKLMPPEEQQITKPIAHRITQGKGAKIAFIIDDWGYKMTNCHYLKEIKAPLAIAILPNLRHTDDIVKCANIYDKEIILHLPMEAYHNYDPYPDNYLIKTSMTKEKVEKILEDSFKKIPLITGVNNHMGSKATEDKVLMKTVLKKIRQNGLFFVDSMTAPNHSVCSSIADELKMPFAKRDVFLDNINTREEIEKQLIELVTKAKRKGYAIAIGHDRPLTMQILKEVIPTLQKQGFEIVRVKDLVRNKR